MGWFSRITKNFIEPVVQAVVEPVIAAVQPVVETVVQAVSPIVEPVITHVIEPIVEITQTAVQALSSSLQSAFSTVANLVDDAITTTANALPEIGKAVADFTIGQAAKALYDTLTHKIDTEYTPLLPVEKVFAPVVGEDELVEHKTIHFDEWTADQTVLALDAIALTQIGFADKSELEDAAGANLYLADGTINDSVIYDYEDWDTGLEAWSMDRFDFIRVEEAKPSFGSLYESNVSLIRDNYTQEYYVSIGGTDGLADIITDVQLTLAGTTLFSELEISGIIDDFFANTIETGATVNIVGASLGGAEAILQYRNTPERFDEAIVVVSAGIGGADGTYYDRQVWDQMGDTNITEINGNDPDTDFNDFVTSLGHVGAGRTLFIDDVIQAEGRNDLEVIDSHLNVNLWASVTQGEDPFSLIPDDTFLFA